MSKNQKYLLLLIPLAVVIFYGMELVKAATIAPTYPKNTLISSDKTGNRLIATTTDPLYVGSVEATSTATSTLPKIDFTEAQGTNLTLTNLTVSNCISGCGGSPGGADTQVQFNDSSSFGGSSLFTFDKNNGSTTVGLLNVGSTTATSSAGRFEFTRVQGTELSISGGFGLGGAIVCTNCVSDAGVVDTITLTNITQITNRDITNLTTSATAGRLFFSSGAVPTSDAGLSWDDTNDRLGVGTSTPGAKFSVGGGDILFSGGQVIYASSSTSTIPNGATNAFSVATSTTATPLLTFNTSNGNVGIGTTSPGATFAVGGNGYILGGLGVGRSTTTSGNIDLEGDASVNNLTVRGECSGCGGGGGTTTGAIVYSDQFNTSGNGEPDWGQTDSSDELDIEACEGTGCTGSVLGFNNTNGADSFIYASSSPVSPPFTLSVKTLRVSGVGDGDFVVGVRSDGSACANGFGVGYDDLSPGRLAVFDNGTSEGSVNGGFQATDVPYNVLWQVDSDWSTTAYIWAATTTRANALSFTTGAQTPTAAGTNLFVCFDSSDANAYGMDVWDLKIRYGIVDVM